MKSSITTTQVFKYVLLFTFLFAIFLALAITYNKVFKMKNETISIIEKYEGVIKGKKSLEIVNNYLFNKGYNTKGYCDNDEYGVKDLGSSTYELSQSNVKYYYCLSDRVVTGENKDRIYYNIKLFYKFNLPFIGDILTFNITGETKAIQYYSDSQKLYSDSQKLS